MLNGHSFNNEAIQLTQSGLIDDLENAKLKGISPAKFALMNGRPADFHHWPDIIEQDEQEVYADVNLLNIGKPNLLTEFSKSIAKSIQFPVNTVFLHGLGVLSSAMVKSFDYIYHGESLPVGIYAVTAQPPSTGKSGVHNAFSRPIHRAFADYNKKARTELEKLNYKLEDVKEVIKKSNNEQERSAMIDERDKILEQMSNNCVYTYSVDDATSEALSALASKQQGVFSVCSDEADAINVLLGNVYGDGNGNANHGLMLKGWDGGFISSARVARGNESFAARGAIAVIAQDETIDSLFEAGRSGRGISERIMMLKEKTLLGTRDLLNYTPVDGDLIMRYEQLINKLVNTPYTCLKPSQDAVRVIAEYRQSVEHTMGDEGENSNAMLRGVVGKADKQIMKIASVLHIVNTWEKSSPIQISKETVVDAISIFNQLLHTYKAAADQKGFAGEKTELDSVKDTIVKRAQKGKLRATVKAISDAQKNKTAFKGVAKVTQTVKRCLLELEQTGYIALVKNDIYISPKLK